MTPLQVNIIMILATAIITALVTFFITSVSQRGMFEKLSSHYIKHHEDTHHQQNIQSEIRLHQSSCSASVNYTKMEKMLTFLYFKMGGQLKDLDGIN